jgi:hypothetical protein
MMIATPALACNLNAIPAAERPRYRDLTSRLRGAIVSRSELPDGYAFQLNGTLLSLEEVAAWIALERKCCPFLAFQLSTSGSQSGWSLSLTGPTGVKALLQTEFPPRP